MGDASWSQKTLHMLRSLQWTRGARAGVSVAGAMLACKLLGAPMGWAALGGFEAVLVDNGGPYRSRLETIATLLGAGSVLCVVGAMVSGTLWVAIPVTALVCFVTTYARVASERIASTSVIILVLYFAGFGRANHSFDDATLAASQFVLGGLWAAALTLILWPVDPFRPARNAVAECYAVLSEFTRERFREEKLRGNTLPSSDAAAIPALTLKKEQTSEFQRVMRLKIEAARRAIGTAPARVSARTVRARNLAVLLETADMLFAITLRWRELAEDEIDPESEDALRGQAAVREAAAWLSGAEQAVADGLRNRPEDRAASYLPEGSHSLEHVQPRLNRPRWPYAAGTTLAHLARDEQEALENIQIAFESVRAIWTGLELRSSPSSRPGVNAAANPVANPAAAREQQFQVQRAQAAKAPLGKDGADRALGSRAAEGPETADSDLRLLPLYGRWVEALRTNWTKDSVMMRHALRMGVVGAIDIVLMRLTHVRHGTWLAMTSIIVLQPYGSGTVRKGMQRVGGTIAGGLLAAVLATGIHGQVGLIAMITVASMLTLATYAVNYAWYCFFLTPTFVLMSMPYFRDWSYAGVRMLNTVLGALVAIVAMRLLWPERQEAALGRLLGRGARADADYLRAMLRFWRFTPEGRLAVDREMLAPARRLSGLAINDAEESLDRMMLEPGIGKRAAAGDLQTEALTFVTYLRRLMRVATTLTAVGSGRQSMARRVSAAAARLEAMAAALESGNAVWMPTRTPDTGSLGTTVEEQQMRRMERQLGVLERAAAELVGKTAG
jgi:uncharacterized membrane protein YgaE (UPF0421/DUF939 family)